jgi:hypothetical protein
MLWNGFIWLSSMFDFCAQGNEPSDSIQAGEFIDHLSNYQILKKDSAYGVRLFGVEQVFFVFAGYSCFYQLLFVAILHTDFGK